TTRTTVIAAASTKYGSTPRQRTRAPAVSLTPRQRGQLSTTRTYTRSGTTTRQISHLPAAATPTSGADAQHQPSRGAAERCRRITAAADAANGIDSRYASLVYVTTNVWNAINAAASGLASPRTNSPTVLNTTDTARIGASMSGVPSRPATTEAAAKRSLV